HRPRPPLRPALVPYTTLFRSNRRQARFGFPKCCAAGGIGSLGAGKDFVPGREPCRGSIDDQLQLVSITSLVSSIWIAVHHVAERSEEHTSELQSRFDLVCRLL